ncbi:MAG: 23S rRNA (uracil-5-)-methyltransferase RumA [Elusimicrobia bacterium RIFOXYB2_FULL_49_7]|nr:MAG: 23S rRNA (uracil-5-)-methyltransferase RumA [Elusimicrobia bacterium RIFOXYB2_FULL_49_7]
MRTNETVHVKILRMGYNGEGVGSLNGKTLFVPGALPDEEVKVRITFSKQNYCKGQLQEILIRSPNRVNPICPIFGQCGGCQLMHLKYDAQLEFKRQQVVSSFQKIGKLQKVAIAPCLPSPKELGYRNKIEVPFRELSGKPGFGFFEFESHRIVPFERCHIHTDAGDKIFSHVKKIILDCGVRAYNEDIHNRSLRHILIKTAVHNKEALVVLVTNGFEIKRIDQITSRIMKCHPWVKGVVQNINQERTNVILGKKFHTLAGRPFIEEKIGGLKFIITPSSFFQINPFQVETLIQTALKAAALTGNERVMDAYCGVGLFSLFLARQASEVIGVEWVHEAVKNGARNADVNHITNVNFHCGRAERTTTNFKNFDTVLLDPPRAGCDPAFLAQLVRIKPKRIVYVSCNPATLARDLADLCHNQYKVVSVQPLDMFPQTAHVETVVTLKR